MLPSQHIPLVVVVGEVLPLVAVVAVEHRRVWPGLVSSSVMKEDDRWTNVE